jgi:hypothetical protein
MSLLDNVIKKLKKDEKSFLKLKERKKELNKKFREIEQ